MIKKTLAVIAGAGLLLGAAYAPAQASTGAEICAALGRTHAVVPVVLAMKHDNPDASSEELADQLVYSVLIMCPQHMQLLKDFANDYA